MGLLADKNDFEKINIISHVHYCFIQHILCTRNWSYIMATNDSLLHLRNKNGCQRNTWSNSGITSSSNYLDKVTICLVQTLANTCLWNGSIVYTVSKCQEEYLILVNGPSEYAVKSVGRLWKFCLGLNFNIVCLNFSSLTGFIHPSTRHKEEAKIALCCCWFGWGFLWVFFLLKACKIRVVTGELDIKPGITCSLVNK